MDATGVWICTGRTSAKYPDTPRCHSIEELSDSEYVYEEDQTPGDADDVMADGDGADVTSDVMADGGGTDAIADVTTGDDASATEGDVSSDTNTDFDSFSDAASDEHTEESPPDGVNGNYSAEPREALMDSGDGVWVAPIGSDSSPLGRLRPSDKLPAKKIAPQVCPKPRISNAMNLSLDETSSKRPSSVARGDKPALLPKPHTRASSISEKQKPEMPAKRTSLSTIVPFRVKGAKVKDKVEVRGGEILAAMRKQSLLSVSSEEDLEADSDVYFDWYESDDESKRDTAHREIALYGNVDTLMPEPTTKAHRIALEILTTEQAYVQKLEILQQAWRETSKILGEAISNEMFPGIDSICKLHKENMLPHLTERMMLWESSKRIGDIMRTFSPFLKLYTDYVKNYDQALQLIALWTTKSKDFSGMVNKLPSIAEGPAVNLKLQITSHMLEPIQRVPRYELLLRQYLKQITEDSLDFVDVTAALTTVSATAKHFEESMKQGNIMGEMIALQQTIDSPYSIISPGRYLVKQGKLSEVNATTGKVAQRYAFLFNDLLLMCAEQFFRIPGVFPKYKVKQMMHTDGMQITEGDSHDVEFTFYVKTQQRALELCASTEEEKADWQTTLWKTVGDGIKKRISRDYSLHPDDTVMNCRVADVGQQAPVWIHNSQVSMCQLCAAEFKGFRKKHHCRACGKVICSKCSTHTLTLEYAGALEKRVCDECFSMLTLNKADRIKSAAKKESHFEARARAVCIHTGFLQLSMDEGKSWQRQWCEIHEGGVFFSFKAQQDITPAFSVLLEGCNANACRVSRETELRTIRLVVGNKTYFFKEETQEKAYKWIDHIREWNHR